LEMIMKYNYKGIKDRYEPAGDWQPVEYT
jgi:hypothetical protein